MRKSARVEETKKIAKTTLGVATARDDGGNTFERHGVLSPPGRLHMRQLKTVLRAKENLIVEKHASEVKVQRKLFQTAGRALKRKHEAHISQLLEQISIERSQLRENIELRMEERAKRHEESTIQLRKTIEVDVEVMQEALRAEDKRLVDAEARSFARAQALISAQVFHEVRNALSSIVAMSEITSSLREDTSVSPSDLVSNVDDLLDQSQEVVTYALAMLNNIMDTSKINSGALQMKCKPFDLSDLMNRVTKMQLAKVNRLQCHRGADL